MKIEYFDDYDTLSSRGAELVTGQIRKKKDLLLCAATGGSPGGVYRLLAGKSASYPQLFAEIRVIQLDEWLDLPAASAGTCELYLQEKLLVPLGIPAERYISFRSDTGDPVQECERVRSALEGEGPIDLALLGIGKNGHIGLNEPGEHLDPFCHVVELSAASRQHRMLEKLVHPPTRGITLGLREILSSRKIILLATGEDKEEAIQCLLSRRITSRCPASLLWLHPEANCLVQRNKNLIP